MRLYSKRSKKIDWQEAEDIKEKIQYLVERLDLVWVDLPQVHCYRSENANTRAYARIWGLNRIWQQVLKQKPTYIIEVISEKFDKLSEVEQDKVLLHEIAHIPRNFSGSLVPHTRHKVGSFHDKLHEMIHAYNRHK